MRPSILYAGVPHFALALMDAGQKIRGVVMHGLQDDDDTYALIQRCIQDRVPVWPARALSKDATRVERAELREAGPFDLVLVANFHRRLPPWAIKLGKRGAWNVHPSLLPSHRGYNPYYWTIKSGDAEAGVTVHHITGDFDAGDIIAQERIEVPLRFTSGHLWEELNRISVPLLLRLLKDFSAKKRLPRVKQDPDAGAYDPRPDDAELTVDPYGSVEEVLRHIRAGTPEPGLLLQVLGRIFVVRGAIEGPPPPSGTSPGDVFIDGGRACVVVKDGSIRPYTVELPGGMVDLAAWAQQRGGGS